jgi:D-alanyl-lipoteichoic acid acyltransferase DltB (MBOAT superfamily)
MLFNSYAFLFLYFPVVFAAFFAIGRHSRALAALWLFAASLFFYGWWNPAYVGLLIGSILFNFAVGSAISREHGRGAASRAKALLVGGVGGDLALLAYYKYANFFVANTNQLLGTGWQLPEVILPLGISFFTFTQIAFLVDAYRGEVKERNFIHYGLFVTYFPHLIAGPVLHHKEMMPQFAQPGTYRPRWENVSVGLSIFVIGLFKKTVLADGIAQYSTPVFDAAAAGQTLTLFEAWGGALAYTFQLYFDFSGYSDMAIGLSRMFGVKLPLNFHSPYKATSIVEFWRRWHITLSRFLRDYLYFALGGNRRGRVRRYLNLMVTMLLGGLWHGAGWTFLVWGGLHGVYLCVNHAWSHLADRLLPHPLLPRGMTKLLAWLMTFVAVVIGWVFFRAASFDAAVAMLEGMAGLNGVAVPNALAARLGAAWPMLAELGVTIYLGGGSQFIFTWLWAGALLTVAVAMPNTQQIMHRFEPVLQMHRTDEASEVRLLARLHPILCWTPNRRWAVATGTVAALGVLAMSRISEFLYFQF